MDKIVQYIITGYFAIMSIIGFTLMGIDKSRAVKRKWRIPERTLLIVAMIGGGIGSFLGMYSFRHKTKHTRFVILLPLSAIIYVLCLLRVFQMI